MTDVLRPPGPVSAFERQLVPTARQLDEGFTPTDPTLPELAPTPVEPSEDAAERRGFREYLVQLDPRAVKGPKGPLAIFFVLAVLMGVDDGVFAIVLPELRAEFGGDIGPLIAAGTAVGVLTRLVAPLFGYLVDRVNRSRLVQIANIGSNIVGLLAPLFGRSLLSVTMYRGASGVVAGVQSSAPNSMLPDYYEPESFSRVLVLLSAATALAGVVTPIAAGISVDALGGWRGAAMVLGIAATLVALVSLFLKDPPRGRFAVAGELDEDAEPPTFSESVRSVRSIRTLRRIWWATIFTGAFTYGVDLFLSLYWAEVFGLTPTQRGYLRALGAAFQFLVLFASAPAVSRLAIRQPRRIMILFGAIVIGVGAFTVVMAWSDVLLWSILASIPVSVGAVALAPALNILLLRILPVEVRGFGLTSIMPFLVGGQILFTIAVTSFPNTSGGLRGLALTFIPFTLIGGYFLMTAAASVDRDIRAADASRTARQHLEEQGAALLVCRDLEVEIGGATIIDGVALTVLDGEFVALLGTNGAGKSTLLRAISGINAATNGAILYEGRNIAQEPAHLNAARGIVFVPGGRAVFPTLTVRENLETAIGERDADTADAGGDFADVFRLFPELQDRLDRRAGDLSGGEQQMVAIGQAVLMRPRLLMIDELSLGLAPAVIEKLLDALRVMNAEGTTIIVVEQSLNVALTIADRAVFMDRGRIQFDGATDELLARDDLIRSVFMGGASSGASMNRRSRPAAVDLAPVIEVDGVEVVFGGVTALSDVSLAAVPQEVLGILGPNGAGKTTLFDAISGFVPTAQGQVRIDGIDVGDAPPDVRASLGLVRSFQEARLFPSLTVRENLAVAFERLASKNAAAAMIWAPKIRRTEERINRRVDGLIELLGLGALADKFVVELSTGSRRAVDVAVVMAADPKVLLLDEPTSGLAQAEVEALGPVIQRLARESGAAVLVIEHDIPLLASVSDRLMAMELGRVVCTGDPSTVLANSSVLAAYLNASEQVLQRSGDRMSTIAAAIGVPPTERTEP